MRLVGSWVFDYEIVVMVIVCCVFCGVVLTLGMIYVDKSRLQLTDMFDSTRQYRGCAFGRCSLQLHTVRNWITCRISPRCGSWHPPWALSSLCSINTAT